MLRVLRPIYTGLTRCVKISKTGRNMTGIININNGLRMDDNKAVFISRGYKDLWNNIVCALVTVQ